MTIRKLPEELAAKIAAGEVVERPVSVVKELVENAIDAGATSISIEVDAAGKECISVEDNGTGIPSAEVRTAIQRYSTSKISETDDLYRIGSLGFRGEALASISAVSRFRMTTRNREGDTGTDLLVEGGKEIAQKRVGMEPGTRIIVQNLFFNVPARYKFLKKDTTERRLISELVHRYALVYPDIRFKLVLDGRQALLTDGGGDYREVLQKMYDLNTARKMIELVYKDKDFNIKGFISPLSITRSSRKDIFFAVNGRLVSDGSLTAAVLRAYHGLLMVGRFPLAAVFIYLKPEEIDVNVHPAKTEIKFNQPDQVFRAVHSAVRKTISAYASVPDIPPSIWSRIENVRPLPGTESDLSVEPEREYSGEKENRFPEIKGMPLLRVIGQLGSTYIAAEGPDGLYLIDQHAAHERVLYEKLMNPSEDSENASQYLLEPETVHIGSGQQDMDPSQLHLMEKMGFILKPFGPDTYRIIAVPVVISHMDPKEAFLSAIEPDEGDGDVLGKEKENRIITRICKRAAVKGGQVLSFQEQEMLVRKLEICKSPRTCPHGRPTMIHLSVNMLERQFGRQGSI